MPKIIEGLRERILAEARTLLLGEGYAALTVRAVAGRCGVAVGTVYNYYPSKDLLTASVMLDDWLHTLEGMRQGTAQAADLAEGLRSLFEGLASFGGIYREAWSQYTAGGGALSTLQARHGMLVGQLTELLTPLLARLSLRADEVCVEIAANTLLSWSQRAETGFDAVAPALLKLLG